MSGSRVLIKVDRNGTKYFQQQGKCDRCNGRGWFATGTCNGQLVPARPDNAVCYKCLGTGTVLETVKEYTPEYAAKLADRRAKAAAKKAAQLEEQRKEQYESNKAASLKQNGFSSDGNTWLFLGNTFSRKDEIKEAGAKWHGVLGWHIDHPVEGFSLLMVALDEVATFTAWGRVMFKELDASEWESRKKEAFDKMNGVKPSDYIGAVGDKITVQATLVRRGQYEIRHAPGMWGTSTVNVYTFSDDDGNLVVWKTSTYIDMSKDGEHYRPIQEGDRVQISGKVKELSEYKGDKQTVLTRCKVVAA